MSSLESVNMELTIVMPCLNESETLAICIDKAMNYIKSANIQGEVLIADNGSTDGSQQIAIDHGARVIDVPVKGYGAALNAGINAAKGKFIIMGDSDDSYDFSRLEGFVEKLREGYDLVMGNRFMGGIAKGAMPPLHKYLGNPVLSAIGRLFFPGEVRDFHCGLRGFNRKAILGVDLRTTGMEFASEMVVKVKLHGLKTTEIPTTLSVDGRSGSPHLNSWRDGWRHLRFLLMFCPRWLFLYPGLATLIFGLLCIGLVLPGTFVLGKVGFDVHTMIIGSAATMVGTEIIIFFLLSKQYAMNMEIIPPGDMFLAYRERFTLERAISFGVLVAVLGGAGTLVAVLTWVSSGFGELNFSSMTRLLVPSVTLLAIGIQVVLAGFFSSILDLKTKHSI